MANEEKELADRIGFIHTKKEKDGSKRQFGYLNWDGYECKLQNFQKQPDGEVWADIKIESGETYVSKQDGKEYPSMKICGAIKIAGENGRLTIQVGKEPREKADFVVRQHKTKPCLMMFFNDEVNEFYNDL